MIFDWRFTFWKNRFWVSPAAKKQQNPFKCTVAKIWLENPKNGEKMSPFFSIFFKINLKAIYGIQTLSGCFGPQTVLVHFLTKKNYVPSNVLLMFRFLHPPKDLRFGTQNLKVAQGLIFPVLGPYFPCSRTLFSLYRSIILYWDLIFPVLGPYFLCTGTLFFLY